MFLRPLTAALALALVLAAPLAQASDWSVAGGGNFQYDWARFRSDAFDFADDSFVRRSRLSVTAKSKSGWELKAEYDLRPGVWTDVYAKYAFGDGHSLRVGQYKHPVFLDELTSDKVTTFMEEALPTAFIVSRREGVEYGYTRPTWSVTGTAFGKNINNNSEGSDTLGFAARGTWLPWKSDAGLLHLGASLASEDPDTDRARFSARPEAALAARPLVDTGSFDRVDRIQRFGLEAAWIHGPWSVQSEYLRADVSRDGGADDFSGDGFYVYGSWFATGHSRAYKGNSMDGPALDGGGAWELALRYSTIDLDDGAILGGEESNWTAGVNFYANKYMRFMANYVVVDSDRRGTDDNPNILEFRAQLAW